MDVKTLKTCIGLLPAHVATLMRGPTGVGKSHVAKDVADALGLPFIDVRGSTMDEAKVGGIPDFETSKERGVSTFCPPSWYKRACDEPVLLMLDELNRSMPQVQQAFFQIVLDRELGNDADGVPLRLHPETRIIAAVNVGNEYDVNDMDPALLRRFWVCDLEPTVADWIDWATEFGLDKVLVEFIQQNPEHWRVDPASVECGSVVPTPASWHRLSDTLVGAELAPAVLAGGNVSDSVYPLTMGFVGTEAAITFTDFLKNYERNITAEDILDGKVTAEDLKDLPASAKTSLIDKISTHAGENKWKKAQVKRVAAFATELGGEFLIATFTAVQRANNMANLLPLNKLIGMEVVDLVNQARAVTKD
jgi:hypothetical protein